MKAELDTSEEVSVVHEMNREIHPALCKYHEQMGKALRAYRVGMEDYRDEVLARGRRIESEFQAAMDGMSAGLLTVTRASISYLSKTYPALFSKTNGHVPNGQENNPFDIPKENPAESDIFHDMKKRHGLLNESGSQSTPNKIYDIRKRI